MSSDTRYVEDVAQEALVKTQKLWSRIRWYDKPEAWTIKVAVRLLRAWQARDRRQVELTEEIDSQWNTPAPGEDLLDLYRAISQLSASNAAAIKLQLLGYSTVEIAEVLCIEVPAVKARLSRGRKALRDLLGDGVTEGAQ